MGAFTEVVTSSELESSVPSRVGYNRVSRAQRVKPRWLSLVGRAEWSEPIGPSRLVRAQVSRAELGDLGEPR